MQDLIFIKRIRLYSLLSFLIPLVALNLCLMIYYYIGNVKGYVKINWDNKVTKTSWSEYNTSENYFLPCPVYKINKIKYKLNNNEIKEVSGKDLRTGIEKIVDFDKTNITDVIITHSDEKDPGCIKNHPLFYFVVSNLKLENKIQAIKKNNPTGFSEIKNPYLFGEASISRTARSFPGNFIFKPLVILSAIFLFIYWLNNLKFFNWVKNNKQKNFSKKFFYLGCLSCLFLILHSIFLGVEFDSSLYKLFRKTIIILFILFEILAQLSLTINLVKLSEDIKEYINLIVIKIKVIFICIGVLVTIISFYILIFMDPSTNFKHILEWNYFTYLLIYYFLSRLLWKKSVDEI